MSAKSLFALHKGWEVTTLGEVCRRGGGNIQTGPFGSQLHASDYVDAGIPSIMPQNIGDNRILEDGIARIAPEDAERLAKYLVVQGDIVYSRRGDVERRSLVRAKEHGWLCGTGCLRIRFGKGIVYPEYAAHYLAHPQVREWIVRHAHGATMPNLNTSILSEVPFVLPSWDEQVEIANILECIDNKIDLSIRINQTIEAMAQAIFSSWLVDFIPVKAKSIAIEKGQDPQRAAMRVISGKSDDELDKMPRENYDQLSATAALFPEKLEVSDLKEVPEGWKPCTLDELVELNPSEKIRKGTLAPYIDMASISTSGSWCNLPVIREFGSGSKFRNRDVLLARITPCLENGKTAFVQNLPEAIVGWGSTEFIVMRTKGIVPAEFIYTLSRSESFRNFAIQSMTGTSGRQRAQASVIAAYRMVDPGKPIWEAFAKLLYSFFEAIRIRSGEAESLSQLRDALIPKLLSGELSTIGIDTREGLMP